MTVPISARYAHLLPAGLVGLSLLLLVVDLATGLYVFGTSYLLSPFGAVAFAISITFYSGIAYGGWWLHRSDIESSRYPRVAGWVAGFSSCFLFVNALIMVFMPGETLYANFAWGLYAFYSGAAGGVVVGIFEARAINRAVEAEREAVHAEHAEAQRQWLDYLNSLLRHEVLNNASIIQGYASLLLEEGDLESPAREWVETIHRQSGDMTDVIRDVRVLVRAADQIEYTEPVDVAAVLAEELGDVRATYPEVETDLKVDGEAYVPADDLLPRVFSNLLSNAIEHNPAESPTVEVTVSTSPDAVRVAIADDGPGVSEEARGSLFERSQEDHGLGLYLVRVLADRYDGTVELTETGPDGSVFTVELPRAEPPSEGGPDPARPDEAASATQADD